MRAALAGPLLLLAAASGFAAEAPQAREAADPAPLAPRTLLLDVARAGDRLVAVGAWGDVVLSDDEGLSWSQADFVPTRRTLTAVTFVDPRRGWAVGHDATILHSADGGRRWQLQHRAPEADAPLLSVWFEDASHGIAVGGFGLVLETRDGGSSWETRRLRDAGEEPHLNDIFALPDGTLFIAAEYGRFFRSRDGGRRWELLRLPYEGSLWAGLAVPGRPPAILALGMRGSLFRSDDGGDSWQAVDTGSDQSLQSGTRLRDGSLVLVGLGGVVLTSRDGGRAFQAQVQPARSGLAAAIETRDGRILLFGEDGVVPFAAPSGSPPESAPPTPPPR